MRNSDSIPSSIRRVRTCSKTRWRFRPAQLRGLIERHPDFYPMYTIERPLEARRARPGPTGATASCPGMMWIFYGRAARTAPSAGWWREQAIRYSRPLEPRKLDRDVHDLGFIFMSTYYRWYEFTRDPALKAGAGRGRPHPGAAASRRKGEYLRSFVAGDSLFIDIMMNVGIIFYAARRDRRPAPARHRHAALADLAPGAGARRRLHRARGHLRSRDRRVPETDPRTRAIAAIPAGRAAWPGRSTASAPATAIARDPRFLADRGGLRRFLHPATPADGVPPWDFDAPAGEPQAAGYVGGGHRRRRSVPTRRPVPDET